MALLTFACVLPFLPAWLRREDYGAARQAALAMSARVDEANVSSWINEHTPSRAVFLCGDFPSVLVVGPAGRRVVSVRRSFSNPYLDERARRVDRDRMFAALAQGDVTAFRALARAYHVTYVLTGGEGDPDLAGAPGLREMLGSGRFRLYSVLP
jgi:hypothetical protein